jgi:iron-sulfur cluster repair protein YtfE (RIC family)
MALGSLGYTRSSAHAGQARAFRRVTLEVVNVIIAPSHSHRIRRKQNTRKPPPSTVPRKITSIRSKHRTLLDSLTPLLRSVRKVHTGRMRCQKDKITKENKFMST